MNFLKKTVYVAVGVVIGVSAAVVPQAIAAVRTKNATLTYMDVKVKINGVETELTDLEGRVQEPVVIDSTIYAPFSATVRALGKVSTYDGNTVTVNITDRTPENNSGLVPVKLSELSHLSAQGSAFEYEAEGHDNTDTYVSDCLKVWHNSNGTEGTRDYYLNGQYAKFTGTYYLDFASRDRPSRYYAYLKMWGDGKLIYESKQLVSGVLPMPFEVNLEGVKTLKITITGNCEDGSFISGIAGGLLYKYK